MNKCSDCGEGRECGEGKVGQDVIMTAVRDAKTGELVKRLYLCTGHRRCYTQEGFHVFRCYIRLKT